MMLNRTLITPDSLMATVPKMPFEQALRTLSKALERHESREIGFQTEAGRRKDACQGKFKTNPEGGVKVV